MVGRVLLGRYRLDELLSIGGTGAVFRGHQLTLKRDVAVKVLHPELTRNERVFKRFQREAESTARFEHPNIVQVMEAGSSDDGFHFIVMQLLDGLELHDLLGEPMSPRRSCELMLQIIRGLEHAHQKGVVHRDLKPENIFVVRDHEGAETIKLVDFGLAKLVEGAGDDERLTRLGMVFGTPSYMSPEQATGREIDRRTDLYNAGLIFYGMLAGRPPFLEEDPVALMQAQVKSTPPPLPDEVPTELAELVFALLAKKPEDRPPHASDVRTRLEQLLPRMPEVAGARRRAAGWWKFAAVGLLAAALALLFLQVRVGDGAESATEHAEIAMPSESQSEAATPEETTREDAPAEPAPTPSAGPDPKQKPAPPEPAPPEPAPGETPAQSPPAQKAEPSGPGPKPKKKSSSTSSKGKKKKKKEKGFKFGGFRRPGGG